MPESGKKRIALVTGASGAIGGAVAELLAQRGEDVYLGYRSQRESAEARAAYLRETYAVQAVALPLELLDRESIRRAVQQIHEQSGRLDILVHSAGVARDKLLIQTQERDFDESLEIHTASLFRLLQACLPVMRSHRYGRIVAFTSYAALHGRAGQSAYAASKAALIGLIKAAALEEIPHGITLNAVAPSVTESAMTDALSNSERARLLAAIPIGRMQTSAEAARLAVWLTSQEASSISGQVLEADTRMHRW
ncbi:SDR family oxidoreductase [Tumebacillus flagellatus]|uniref:Ketoreductase domain-containing protein n=1 Tax=Tumebacillus flagellatus TaxID=1157490 RepID=A0A074LSG4_9BACL|nr:SDR family oxidoreductase [Tumebacillus flagellatus]KEO84059.1 hypothetical protein EL26_06240 [Tumebacillus flagellatus]